MLRRNFRKSSGVILDVCSEHGSWLDADELEQITGFILSGGAPSPVLADPPAARAQRSARAGRVHAHPRAPSSEAARDRDARVWRAGCLKLIKLLLD